MNVWRFETWASLRVTLTWTIAMIAVGVGLLAIYPTYEQSSAVITELLAAYPPQLLAAFGMDPQTLFTYVGFFAFVWPFVMLAGSMFACGLGLQVIGREKQQQTSDFLLTKPRRRGQLWAQKWGAIATLLGLHWVLIGSAMVVATSVLAPEALQAQAFWFSLVGLPVSELLFVSLGSLLAMTLHKLKSIWSLATGVGISFYVIALLQGLLENDALRYLSPLQYVNPPTIVQTNALDGGFIALAIALSLGAAGVSYWLYGRSDVR